MREMTSTIRHLGLGEGREKMAAVTRPSFSRASGHTGFIFHSSLSLSAPPPPCVLVADGGEEDFPESLVLFC